MVLGVIGGVYGLMAGFLDWLRLLLHLAYTPLLFPKGWFY